MGPLGITPSRLRVALIAVLAALAAMAITSPGVASAAPSVSVSCHPATVEPGENTQCLALINTGSASTPAGGKVAFVKTAGPTVNMGAGTCTVQPESGGTGSCSLGISGLVEGKVSLFAVYSGPGGLASGTGSFTIAGKASIECLPGELVVGESTKCRVFIPGIANSFTHPTGIVEWSASGAPGHPVGDIDPECTLLPAPEGASCAVTFTPSAAGKPQLVAEYKGDPGGNQARTLSTTVTVAPGFETLTHVECGGNTAVTFSRPVCRAVVLSPEGLLPHGSVSVEAENLELGGFPDPASCTLQPTGGPFNETDCSFRYEPRMPGVHALTVTYPGAPRLLDSTGDFRFFVSEGEPTFTELACKSAELGEVGNCVITVLDHPADGSVTPKGTVTIGGSGGMGPSPKSMEFGADSCELIPVAGMSERSRCEIRYEPLKFGTLTIRAEYQGDRDRHQVSKGEAKVKVSLPEAQ